MKPPMKKDPDPFEEYDDELDCFLLSFIDEDYEFKTDDPDIWDGFSYPDEEYFLPMDPSNVQDLNITFNQRTY